MRAALVLACTVLAVCTCAVAQGSAQGGGWAAVEGIAPGAQVEVRLAPHGTAKGAVASVSGSGVDIQNANGSIRQIPKAQIAKLYLVGKSHKLRDGLTGVGILGGAGAVFGYTRPFPYSYTYPLNGFPVPHDERPYRTAAFGLMAGAAGAVLGVIIGSHHPKTLVYSAAGQASARKEGGRHRGLLVQPGAQ